MGRKVNDGDQTGIKQDKFRHSRFDRDHKDDSQKLSGNSFKSSNTLGGVFQENRGRRFAEVNPRSKWDGSPFED